MNLQKVLQTIKQYVFPRTRALEHELSVAIAENQTISAELEKVRDDFKHTLDRDTHKIADLQQKIIDIEYDRSATRHQVHVLETSLGEASLRLENTEQQVSLLGSKLEEERSQHASSLDMTRESLASLLGEQQTLMKLQSELAQIFQEGNRQLVESIQATGNRPQLPAMQMTAIAGLFFISGALVVGVAMNREVQNNPVDLSTVTSGINDFQVLMKKHFVNHDEVLKILTEALNRKAAGTKDPQTKTPPVSDQLKLEKGKNKPSESGSATATSITPGGPPLLMPDASIVKPAGEFEYAFDATELQHDLITLGFNLGQQLSDGISRAKTEHALEEFRLLYLSAQHKSGSDQLASILRKYAKLAREDEKRFNIDSPVMAAIRLGHLQTGVEFPFLMELAATESSFNPGARASSSSAAGLYQFKRGTWLDAIRLYGKKYGIGDYASQVEYVVNSKGNRQPVIHDNAVYQHVIHLRYNPRIMALLAAENIKKNMQRLEFSLNRKPGRTDLYLTHFFGATGAVSFLKALEENPDEIAGDIFPGPATRNRNIFRMQTSRPRTVAEVYKVFERKFNTSRYDEGKQS